MLSVEHIPRITINTMPVDRAQGQLHFRYGTNTVPLD
jgi:hypothetical protein